jgi:hypothetical protein
LNWEQIYAQYGEPNCHGGFVWPKCRGSVGLFS